VGYLLILTQGVEVGPLHEVFVERFDQLDCQLLEPLDVDVPGEDVEYLRGQV